MSNNDKFIIDTPFGKLMESETNLICIKCKYYKDEDCINITDGTCIDNFKPLYFAKDETDEE